MKLQDYKSANHIDWDTLNEKESLIDSIIEMGYILTEDSHEYLRKNKRVVLSSIKKDINSIKFADKSVKYEKSIFKYLMLNGYEFNICELKNISISYLRDIEILNYCLEHLVITEIEDKTIEFLERFKVIIIDFLNSMPKLSRLEKVFQIYANIEWNDYRKKNIEFYENIFGKICRQLQSETNFETAISKMNFLPEMERVLGKKISTLYLVMEEYFNIFHSNIPNKLEKIQHSKDIISELSAIYISKSKDDYKKRLIPFYMKGLKPYYTLKEDHSIINKKVILKKQKEQFKSLYENKQSHICSFIASLIKKYSLDIPKDIVEEMVIAFGIYDYSNLADFIKKPDRYEEYIRFEKINKLIKRLNIGYISIDGVEVANYKEFIKYDAKENKYVYIGNSFNAEEVSKFNEYRLYEIVFKKIKKDIMTEVKNIVITEEIDEKQLKELEESLPFTDEYYIFNKDANLNTFCLGELTKSFLTQFKKINIESLCINESFTHIYDLLVNDGLIWLLLILDDCQSIKDQELRKNGIQAYNILNLLNNMPQIVALIKEYNIKINNFSDLMSINLIAMFTTDYDITLLGIDIIHKLFKHTDYFLTKSEVLNIANELIYKMAKRYKSTVPYINGETLNYKYSMYDSLDESILVSGIDTNSCLKIGDNDNDFLHYCALNKNGFIIKITDSYGNFIGRASGFRNGNVVYINQLRTIYDISGTCLNKDKIEKEDIIETLRQACEDIVNISQHNADENMKIDFVFITQSYILKDYPSNISDDVKTAIGSNPMDNQSEDWEEFIKNTENLSEAYEENRFYTDYGVYSVICMASSKGDKEIEVSDIINENVPAVYERPRNKIVIKKEIDANLYRKINRIQALNCFHTRDTYEKVSIPKDAIVFTGDNWYIIYKDLEIISSCVLEFDEKAQIEFTITLATINKYSLNSSGFNIEQIANTIYSEEKLSRVKKS